MPHRSLNRVIVQRETEPTHRALQKLRATSSPDGSQYLLSLSVPQMQVLAQPTFGPPSHCVAKRCFSATVWQTCRQPT